MNAVKVLAKQHFPSAPIRVLERLSLSRLLELPDRPKTDPAPWASLSQDPRSLGRFPGQFGCRKFPYRGRSDTGNLTSTQIPSRFFPYFVPSEPRLLIRRSWVRAPPAH